jgi:outer membrane receptor protein involved in Fe transport
VTFGPQLPAFQVIDHSGNTPAFAPRHILNAWGSRRFGGGFSLGAGLRYVGAQFIAENNAFETPGYVTLDAVAAYRKGRYRAALNFRNLTDEEYFTRGFAAASVLPADPFSVHATLEVGFGRR